MFNVEVAFAFQCLFREESRHALCVKARALCLWPSSFRSMVELTCVKSLKRAMFIACFASERSGASVIHRFCTFSSWFAHWFSVYYN